MAQTACETFHMEVEDYTVNIGGAIAGFTTSFRVDENNIFEYTMSPNPTSDFFKYKTIIIKTEKYLKMQLM
jgi:hypothetical protein